ncbi:MAG: hypothetical protein ACE5JH_01840 [Acidobacteriota bacterium]
MIKRHLECPPGPGAPRRIARPRRRGRLPAPALVIPALLMSAALFRPAPAGAAVVPWMSLEQIVLDSRVIVLGTVREVESSWSADGRIIVTRATIEVERSLKGGPRRRVVVETPGGRVGEQFMIASGAPVFAKGERLVLFLAPAGAEAAKAGGGPLAVVGWNQGKVEVRRDPRTGRDLILDRTGNVTYLGPDGREVEPRPRPRGPMELSRFLRDVAAILEAPAEDEAP